MPARFWILSLLCSVLPDADVLGFRFGIQYGDLFGHRGFFHSLTFAVLFGCVVAAIFFRGERPFPRSWWFLAAYFSLVTASHGILDAFTSGGLGIALLSPFDTTRYFFPWTPITVSPIGIQAFFSQWGVRVMLSELQWIWLPSLVLVVAVRSVRALTTVGKKARDHRSPETGSNRKGTYSGEERENAMGIFAKFFGINEKKMIEKEKANFHIVIDRLRKLIKQGVISEQDLTYASVEHGGKQMPQVIATIDRLFKDGHLKGIEDSVQGFCYLVGMGLGVLDNLKIDKK